MTGRRALQKEKTRALLLACARELFEEQGFEATSTRALAKRAGVSVGTVFAHFPDKPSIVAAAFYEDIERTLTEAFDTLPADAAVLEQLMHVAGALFAYYNAQHPSLSRALLREAMLGQSAWSERLDAQAQSFIMRLAALIQRGQERGELREDAAAVEVAGAFFSMYVMVVLAGVNGFYSGVDQQVQALRRSARLLWEGVAKGDV